MTQRSRTPPRSTLINITGVHLALFSWPPEFMKLKHVDPVRISSEKFSVLVTV